MTCDFVGERYDIPLPGCKVVFKGGPYVGQEGEVTANAGHAFHGVLKVVVQVGGQHVWCYPWDVTVLEGPRMGPHPHELRISIA